MNNSMIQRNSKNPILKTDNLKPTADGLKILGVFNPGACRLGDEIILIMRVAEACEPEKGWLKVPVMQFEQGEFCLKILSWKKNGRHNIDTSDPRKFMIDGKLYLSCLSHLHLARSRDGIHFDVSEEPFIFPENQEEAFGTEDCRISQIGDTYFLTYTAVSGDGYGVALATTQDFVHFERYGMIFPPQNKDACFFPEKIRERYIALHRPLVTYFGKPSIWYAESHDFVHWGNHSCVLRPNDNQWEQEKIGAGPQPIKTPEGWLLLYHGCGRNYVYSLSLCLLDLEDPRHILKRSRVPILIPEDAWEKVGLFPNVVFSNGWVQEPDGFLRIYYGAADSSICLAETTVDDLLKSLK